MARKLLDHRMSEPISPLIDVVVNALAAIFIILMIYMVVVQPKEGFVPAGKFEAGDFKQYPVAELVDLVKSTKDMDAIAQQYKGLELEFPHIFIIGHANSSDALEATDRSEQARLERNWNFAGRRASLIAKELYKRLTEKQRERIVVVSTGEFDKRDPSKPTGQENAWVEVVFGKNWKSPSGQSK